MNLQLCTRCALARERHLIHPLAIALATLSFAPASAWAQMTCTVLGNYLASQRNVSQYVPPLPADQVPVPFTQLISTRCEANFIYSSRRGPADGYAVGQAQRIGIRVGFPLNSLDGGGQRHRRTAGSRKTNRTGARRCG
jgi:hypothetical protein